MSLEDLFLHFLTYVPLINFHLNQGGWGKIRAAYKFPLKSRWLGKEPGAWARYHQKEENDRLYL
jgi:hypothetical protein